MSNKKEIAEVAVGAAQEVAHQLGYNLGSPHNVLGQAGAAAVAAVPVVAAKAVVVGSAAAAAAGTVAVAAAPVVAGAALAYGVYRLGCWLFD